MGRKAKDLTGMRIHDITVLGRDDSAKSGAGIHAQWICKCDCGRIFTSNSSNLLRSAYSCGCYLRRKHLTHGKTNTRLYNVWNSLKTRCTNPRCKEYKHYGGRGIKVCDEWMNDFEAFRSWALANGYDENAPRGQCTLDRIDVNGNYEPGNCRWADMKTQANNTRRNKKEVDKNGDTLC